jgi:Domain of unknown function (DUF397)
MSWRKSSRTGSNGNCVEVRNDLTALRDSKNTGPVLPAQYLDQFLTEVKAGTFDRCGGAFSVLG